MSRYFPPKLTAHILLSGPWHVRQMKLYSAKVIHGPYVYRRLRVQQHSQRVSQRKRLTTCNYCIFGSNKKRPNPNPDPIDKRNPRCGVEQKKNVLQHPHRSTDLEDTVQAAAARHRRHQSRAEPRTFARVLSVILLLSRRHLVRHRLLLLLLLLLLLREVPALLGRRAAVVTLV